MPTNIVVPVDALTDVWGLHPVAGGIWVAGSYVSGTVASHNGSLWFANKQTSQEPGAGTDWTLLIAAPWSQVQAFAPGISASATAPVTLVTYNGSLYACAVDHVTSSTFEAGKWTALISASAGAFVEVSGGWNAAANSPALASGVGTNGALYRVTIAGNTTLDGAGSWNVGDYALYSIDRWVKLRGQIVQAKDIADASTAGKDVLTAADVPAQRLALRIDGATTVNDTNAAITSAMTTVAWIALTDNRNANLPALSGLAAGQALDVLDETGQCNPARAITLNRAGADTINGLTSYVIAEPYGGVRLRKISDTKWTAHRLADRVGLRSVAISSYSYVEADNGRVVRRTYAGAMSDTLPVFSEGFIARVQNDGAGILTVTPASGTIAGRNAIAIPPGAGVSLLSDGTNYIALGGIPQAHGKWLLATLVAANSPALTHDTIFQSGFSEYEIEIQDLVPAVNNDWLAFRYRASGAYQATGYRSTGVAASEVGVGGSGNNATVIQLTRNGVVANGGLGVNGSFRVRNPQSSNTFKTLRGASDYMAGSVLEATYCSGVWQNTTPVDGLYVAFVGGNIVSGQIVIHGIC